MGNRELPMGDRFELLVRARRVVLDPNMDGFLAPGGVAEEMLILSRLERRTTGRSFLDGHVFVCSVHRGSLSGTSFEMNHAFM
jgi:Cgl0159-like